MRREEAIYENIKKAVIFLLSSNFGEIMTMFTAILLSLPSPLKASHILWINLITDSLPALALGTDENDGPALMEGAAQGTRMRACLPTEAGWLHAVLRISYRGDQPDGLSAAAGG